MMTMNPFNSKQRLHETVNFHTSAIYEHGIEEYKKCFIIKGKKAELASRKAIDKYYKNQELDRVNRRDEREEEILEAARVSNEIARDSNSLSKWAIFFSLIAIVVSAWVAIATKTG